MQKGRPPKYGIEFALDKMMKELRELIIAMKKFFFRTPKDKDELFIYLVSVVPWLLFVFGIFLATRW